MIQFPVTHLTPARLIFPPHVRVPNPLRNDIRRPTRAKTPRLQSLQNVRQNESSRYNPFKSPLTQGIKGGKCPASALFIEEVDKPTPQGSSTNSTQTLASLQGLI